MFLCIILLATHLFISSYSGILFPSQVEQHGYHDSSGMRPRKRETRLSLSEDQHQRYLAQYNQITRDQSYSPEVPRFQVRKLSDTSDQYYGYTVKRLTVTPTPSAEVIRHPDHSSLEYPRYYNVPPPLNFPPILNIPSSTNISPTSPPFHMRYHHPGIPHHPLPYPPYSPVSIVPPPVHPSPTPSPSSLSTTTATYHSPRPSLPPQHQLSSNTVYPPTLSPYIPPPHPTTPPPVLHKQHIFIPEYLPASRGSPHTIPVYHSINHNTKKHSRILSDRITSNKDHSPQYKSPLRPDARDNKGQINLCFENLFCLQMTHIIY